MGWGGGRKQSRFASGGLPQRLPGVNATSGSAGWDCFSIHFALAAARLCASRALWDCVAPLASYSFFFLTRAHARELAPYAVLGALPLRVFRSRSVVCPLPGAGVPPARLFWARRLVPVRRRSRAAGRPGGGGGGGGARGRRLRRGRRAFSPQAAPRLIDALERAQHRAYVGN